MKKIILFILVYLCSTAQAQPYYNDARLWTNIYFEKTFAKSFNVHLNQKNRWDQNMQRFELGYVDIGVTVKPFKKWNVKFLLDYVYALKQKNNGDFRPRHTAYAAVVLRKDFGRFRLMYRNLAQVTYKGYQVSKTGYIPYYYDRNKVTLKYEATKRLEFYIAEEISIPLFTPQQFTISRSRSLAGLFITVTKHQLLELYFGFQQQLTDTDWYDQKSSYPNSMLKRDYIYGIGYSFLF
jgi:hypothetical protein